MPRLGATRFFISNLHCPSCVHTIEEALSALSPRPVAISTSIISHCVTVTHFSTLPVAAIVKALEASGFDVHSAFQNKGPEEEQILPHVKLGTDWEDSLEQSVRRWHEQLHFTDGKARSPSSPLAAHSQPLGIPASREELSSPSTDFSKEKEFGIIVETVDVSQPYKAEIAIVGMTCSSCVGSITGIVEAFPWVRSVNVALLTNSAAVVFEGKDHSKDIVEAIEDAGFEATIESLEEVRDASRKRQSQALSDTWKVDYAIEGMTCSSCVASITGVVKEHSWVDSVDINLISNSGTIIFKGKENLPKLTETIEDAGFDATVNNVVNVGAALEEEATERTVSIHVAGMYCHHCPPKVLGMLDERFSKRLQIEKAPTHEDQILRIRYIPAPPEFTIRTILDAIRAADSGFQPTIYHPPTIEEKSRELHARERRRVLFRLALSISTAIPAFIIGVVAMSLLPKDNSMRKYIMQPMWAGSVPRAQWALFLLATPVYFFAADTFHRKALKEIKALWRPGSTVPIYRRFIRFGSMNMLMSLGTSIAYLSSIAELIMAATQKPSSTDMDTLNSSFYFDSVIFLTMFLLIGRFLEAYSKAKTGDAVTSLGNLRPTEAILIEDPNSSGQSTAVDLLEVGDVVRVPHGASPPFDGTIIDVNSSFDESSLTGESRLVHKQPGDTVFSGTVNKGAPVCVRLSSVSGTSMLDQIIKVVREGQTKRAPVERAADMITSHFVPFVVVFGILTFVIWIALGESGALPADWLDVSMGGWPLWALRFAIAVFVIACPCGIGLAAPTALFVGGGMAAKHGILVKGGGEAFQEASTLDCIVFDKTGTLTQGGEPKVTDYKPCTDDDEAEILGMAMAIEGQSGHPVATAVVAFCKEKKALPLEAAEVREIPGMGMKGSFKLDTATDWTIDVDVLVGNERLMDENDVTVSPHRWERLQSWKREGKSVVLVAVRAAKNPFSDASRPKEEQDKDTDSLQGQGKWTLSAIFAVADALRPEAAPTIRALQSRGISVWMLSGDNPTTARAVAAQVGIQSDNVIAGVLPDQKAEKIQYLQKSLPYKGRNKTHATVAMVGDGINDSPALTMADVGIAIGSGSDVALSSAEFILISSNLNSLLTLIDLSRAVFRRVWFNFGWALVYNIVAMPVAAGVLYPVKTAGGGHVRLDPVWASLAMALSSVSVVSSSLMLRSRIPFIGFRERKEGQKRE
ncbi:heavy metal translocatin [Rhizodiscina lignyota]|uniref:Heavy metal translocatin n=1 Tax=Rhizodiscina lignyota TaxID=1504668 RepID=A0A9P4I7X9_9PEZI|nr:heavy metal translocatin [Rhizodiscina lignyota]